MNSEGKIKVRLIRSDETEEDVYLIASNWVKELEPLIDSNCFDVVNLRNGIVMIVDDDGILKQKPINWKASMIYWITGHPNSWHVFGDVAIMRDRDLGD